MPAVEGAVPVTASPTRGGGATAEHHEHAVSATTRPVDWWQELKSDEPMIVCRIARCDLEQLFGKPGAMLSALSGREGRGTKRVQIHGALAYLDFARQFLEEQHPLVLQADAFAAHVSAELPHDMAALGEVLHESTSKYVQALYKRPALGLFSVGHCTPYHQHLLGVVHVLLSGTKVWALHPPRLSYMEAIQCQHPSMQITQEQGDVLWLPPGWWHEVSDPPSPPGHTPSPPA